MENNIYEEHLKNTRKEKIELLEEKKKILGKVGLEIMNGEMDLASASKIINNVNVTYDKYIPEDPNPFKK